MGVLGCGLMGSGIAEVVARAGYEVRVVELNEGALEAGSARLVRSLERAVEREKISVQERDRSLDRISRRSCACDCCHGPTRSGVYRRSS